MHFILLQLILALPLAAAGNTAWASASVEQPAASEEHSAAPTAAKTPSEKAAEKTARGREALSAFVMWCSILVLGLALIVAAMVSARRLRMANRRRPVVSAPLDPFWYLKKKPARTAAAGNEPELPGQESSGPAGPGAPGTP